jgi:hypothetical protein
MKKTYLIFSLAVVLTLSMLSTSQAIVVYQDLGTGAPPFSMGGYYMMPFDTAPQASIADYTLVSTIPGSPIFGNLTPSRQVSKFTLTSGLWSHGYTGPSFFTSDGISYTSVTLSLPPFTGAFYFYAMGDAFGTWNITATSNSGVTSGPISVTTAGGAKGFGFFTTEDDEYISSITVTIDAGGEDIIMAEFGIAQAPFQCVGNLCYYNCVTGHCPASHCDVYIPNSSFYTIDVGQLTYHFGMFACIGPCPPTCKIYIPVTP